MPRAPIPNKPKRKVGNPPKPIDWDLVDKLLMANCMTTEIAARIGVSTDCLYDRVQVDKGTNWSAYSTEKKQCGDSLLRSVQFQKALKGDNSMLIWLGKNRLGQTDKLEQKIDATQEITTIEILKPILELPDNEHSYDGTTSKD